MRKWIQLLLLRDCDGCCFEEEQGVRSVLFTGSRLKISLLVSPIYLVPSSQLFYSNFSSLCDLCRLSLIETHHHVKYCLNNNTNNFITFLISIQISSVYSAASLTAILRSSIQDYKNNKQSLVQEWQRLSKTFLRMKAFWK